MTGVRETVQQRAFVLDHRSDRGAAVRARRPEDDLRVLRDQALRDLQRLLRIRLIVGDHELHVAPANAAGFIHVGLERFKRLLIGASDERRAARQRQNRVDLKRIGCVRPNADHAQRRDREYRRERAFYECLHNRK